MQTIVEKILSVHANKKVFAGDTVEIRIDTRVARDFGGANVVRNLLDYELPIENPAQTFFTFDCNPGGSDQKYATNQHFCRLFARKKGINVFDINRGIGTHIMIDKGLILPGETFVSTDSHANIMGAIGAFGQGMGDQDIAYAFANGKIWFNVPQTIKIELTGMPKNNISPKDIVLSLIQKLGAAGLLGCAAELYGPVIDASGLSDRVTMASMATEMGGIIMLFPPNERTLAELPKRNNSKGTVFHADANANYLKIIKHDVTELQPLLSRPGHPDDVVSVHDYIGTAIDSAFIGSCTNGRYEDLKKAAEIIEKYSIAKDVVIKIVPSTDEVWKRCLKNGIISIFKKAGVLLSNAGCAGCAAGQVGQNGHLEVTISTGNRNFAGKQGRGDVYLASPATVAASAVAGAICSENELDDFLKNSSSISLISLPENLFASKEKNIQIEKTEKNIVIEGKIWVIDIDNIDTDMIFHNKHLAITKLEEMGQHTFGNLVGWEDFSSKASEGNIIITGSNFGAGSSRQQAVDCFKSLGITLIIGRSFGAIYERNAVNAGMAIIKADWKNNFFKTGDLISVDLLSGKISNKSQDKSMKGKAFTEIQLDIYKRGTLLAK